MDKRLQGCNVRLFAADLCEDMELFYPFFWSVPDDVSNARADCVALASSYYCKE